MAALRKFVIVRDIPNIGDSNAEALTSISQASCKALAKTGHGEVQWVHTYITQDKTFCIYLATGEEAIRKHGEIGGFPITSIDEVAGVIDPTTAVAKPANA